MREIIGWKAGLGTLPLLVLTACGGGGGQEQSAAGPGPELAESPADDATTFDVEWREDAHIAADVPAVQAALVRADSEAGQLVFKPGFAGLDGVAEGDAVLLGGVGVYRVMGRESTAEGELLNVVDAPLTDVIENGTIRWRKSFLSAADDQKYGLGVGENETTTIRSLRQALVGPDGLSFSQSVSGFQIDFKMKPVLDRTLDMSLTGQYGQGPANIKVKLAGNLRALTNETLIVIEGRSLTDFRCETSRLEGTMKVEAEASALGNLEQKVKVPARYSLPIVLGGIPFHIDLGGAVDVASTLNTKGTASFKGTAQFTGGGGVAYSNGHWTTINSLEQSDLKLDDASLSSNATIGLRVTLTFPEVGIGVGVQQVSANAYLRFKTEVIANLDIKQRLLFLAGLPVAPNTETEHCLTSTVGIGSTYGGAATFLGIQVFDSEQPIWTLYAPDKKTGPACE